MEPIKENHVVLLDLRPNLEDFLIYEFGEDKDGIIKLNKRKDIGIFIDSMWSISSKPVKQNFDNPVKILLPVTNETHYIHECNYLYFSSWRMTQINDYVESQFRLRIREFFQTGYEKGYNQKFIIEGILSAMNIKKNIYSFDMIKQMDYRNRRNAVKKVIKDIQSSIIQ